MNFENLGLNPQLLVVLKRLAYDTATPVQAAAIPAILAGRDLMGCAQTGTGKTAAFALPIIQKLSEHETSETNSRNRRSRPIRALVLSPTRELASQIEKSFFRYGRGAGLRQAVVYGGVSQFGQVQALRSGVDVLIATPGRLLDLMDQRHVSLQHLQILVLDEADQMLDMGFIQPLKQIVHQTPKSRQTLMFSATMPESIQSLASQWLKNPEFYRAQDQSQPPATIKQSVTFLEQSQKTAALVQFLQGSDGQRRLVFCRTKHGTDRLVKHLERAGISSVSIHGNKSQSARERALARFAAPNPPVLVATDVAARGLHMPGISHVINFDLPETAETYVHRIGRTARAGASGESLSYCSSQERHYLRGIERLIGRALEVRRSTVETPVQPQIANRENPDRHPADSRHQSAGSDRKRKSQNRHPNRRGNAATAKTGPTGSRRPKRFRRPR